MCRSWLLKAKIMSYIYSVCLGFDEYNFSSPEGALTKADKLDSDLVKIRIKPLDTDGNKRQATFDAKTLRFLCETRSIASVLEALVA